MDEGTTAAQPSWQTTRDRKRAERAKNIAAVKLTQPGERNGQNETLAAIADAGKIVEMIENGETTAKDVTEVFIQRACEAHEITNCLTETVFSDALREAEELDSYFQRNGRPIGPLHGVPVTLKDQFNIKGVDTTLGYIGRCFDGAVDDAVLVKMLKSLGAVIIAKSNLPQSIMWCETENPLWGQTTNPLNKTYTPGGSTGGEAAILACQASVLGWGTDIGGSVRIPCHMMGLYALKPSSARLPYRGVPVSTEGQEHVPSCVGPMARSIRTLEVAMGSLIQDEPWNLDPRCVPIPWRADLVRATQERPLTIGVLFDDEVVRPHPPVTRVLREAVQALRDAGHDVFEWNAQLHADCIEVMDQFYKVDGGQDIRDAVHAGGEPFIPHVQRLLDSAKPVSVYDYWQLNKRKWELQQAYLDKWCSLRSPGTGRQADVVLMPPMPHSAVPHGSCHWVGYTKVWNVLDYPALVIPGGSVNRYDAGETLEHDARNPLDEKNKKLWDDNKDEMASLKLPVGVQMVCRKLEEEKLLGAGKILDDLVRAHRE